MLQCTAIATSTQTACRKRALPGSRYCVFHIEHLPLFLAGVIGAILSLIISEAYRSVVPSAESRQLIQARRETSELTKIFTEREERLSSQLDALGKGNERLQEQLAPFVELARARFPGEQEAVALNRLVQEVEALRTDLDAVRQLSGIARLGARGVTDTVGGGLEETTPISKALDGAWLEKDGKLYPKCDQRSIQKFKDTIILDKRFPFSYYALAECYKAHGDPSWRSHAQEALAILDKTRKISPHHGHHDEVFRVLSSMLGRRTE